MKRAFLFLLFLIFLAIGCTTTQKVRFNKDWSGKVETTIDMTQLYSLYGGMEEDTTKNPTVFQDSVNVLKLESLKKIEGISDVKIEKDDKLISILSFSFKNIDALNAAAYLMTQDMLVDPMAVFFKTKGKKEIEINLPSLKSEGNDDMSLGGQFLYNLELDFAGKVKSISIENEEIRLDGSTLKVSTDLGKLMDKTKQHHVKVKLK